MIEIASRSTSYPSAENTNGSTSFSVRPSTRTTARARKSSLRAASNSVITRKSSSADTGSGWRARVPVRGRRSTKTSSSIRVDVEKGRRMRRIDDLIPGERELAQERGRDSAAPADGDRAPAPRSEARDRRGPSSAGLDRLENGERLCRRGRAPAGRALAGRPSAAGPFVARRRCGKQRRRPVLRRGGRAWVVSCRRP